MITYKSSTPIAYALDCRRLSAPRVSRRCGAGRGKGGIGTGACGALRAVCRFPSLSLGHCAIADNAMCPQHFAASEAGRNLRPVRRKVRSSSSLSDKLLLTWYISQPSRHPSAGRPRRAADRRRCVSATVRRPYSQMLTSLSLVWHAIAAAIYLDLGRAAAKDLIARSVKGQGRPSQAAEGRVRRGSVPLHLQLRSPALTSLLPTVAAWAYIHPAFPDIVARSKEREERAKENEREERELARKQKRLDSKHAFLRDRYDAILADIPSDEVRALAPCFRDFLHLDNVKDLHDDAEIATEKSRANQDLQVFQERLDAVRDEMNGFAIDVRLHALKLILAATTDTSEEEIEQLDVDILSDPRFDDDFFRRPSSWINCGGDYCSNTGPLVDVLKHWHERHEPDLPDRLDDPVLRFEEDEEEKNPNTSPERLVQLSLEVACAWSALLELGRIDGDDPNVTKEDVEETFKSFRFVWENCPSHKGFPRETWSSLVRVLPPLSVVNELTVSRRLAGLGQVRHSRGARSGQVPPAADHRHEGPQLARTEDGGTRCRVGEEAHCVVRRNACSRLTGTPLFLPRLQLYKERIQALHCTVYMREKTRNNNERKERRKDTGSLEQLLQPLGLSCRSIAHLGSARLFCVLRCWREGADAGFTRRRLAMSETFLAGRRRGWRCGRENVAERVVQDLGVAQDRREVERLRQLVDVLEDLPRVSKVSRGRTRCAPTSSPRQTRAGSGS